MLYLGGMRHSLTEKNPHTMRAVCAVCGPVDLVERRSGVLVCKIGREQQRRRNASGTKHKRGKHVDRGPHGLTTAEARAMREGKLCEICDAPAEAVDHDHATGQIRGVLCAQCNMGIGHFDDDPELLEQAAAYLRRSSTPRG